MFIYFAGIGSTKIAPIAEIAFDAGYKVHGSEIDSSVSVNRLISRGIEVDIGYQNGNFLEKVHLDHPIDYFVINESIDENNLEVLRAKKLNIKIIQKEELLLKLIKEKNLKLIAVGGSHGKTTVTAMLIWVFKTLRVPISYSIQEQIKYGPSGSYDRKSQYFIYECDEFNKNFLLFKPFMTLIASVDYNHPETYHNEKNYREAIKTFAKQSKKVLAWEDEHSDIYQGLDNIKLLSEDDIDTNINLISPKGQRNASLVKASLSAIEITEGVVDALNKFPGLSGRFEKLAEGYYIDCGRSPAEIEAVLEAASTINPNIAVVYQPYSNLLQKYYIEKYTDHLKLKKNILATYRSRP